jgi:uncharacterized repeat protein (TIGR01451 family)
MGTQTLVALLQRPDPTRRPGRWIPVAAPASADRGYCVRFTTNAQGDIDGTGNTLMTCRDSDANCAAARNGTASGATSSTTGTRTRARSATRTSTWRSTRSALTPIGFPGRPVRFLLRFTNNGRDTATSVVVRDILPPGLTPVSAVPSTGTCAGTACRIGRLRPGQTETITVTAVAGLDTRGRGRHARPARDRPHGRLGDPEPGHLLDLELLCARLDRPRRARLTG